VRVAKEVIFRVAAEGPRGDDALSSAPPLVLTYTHPVSVPHCCDVRIAHPSLRCLPRKPRGPAPLDRQFTHCDRYDSGASELESIVHRHRGVDQSPRGEGAPASAPSMQERMMVLFGSMLVSDAPL